MISEMSANSDSWGLLLCNLGSLTFTAEGNTCTLGGYILYISGSLVNILFFQVSNESFTNK